ncbi:hypothetical protein K1719_027885 [Acacia pycnantha]|nr:hypothetical protein K1719_027885 [Acacia pycnantha]
MGINEDNMRYNLTWSFPVDSGFKYLIRLYFCEISMEITQRLHGYGSYGKWEEANMLIALHPNMKSKPKYADAILNGIEVLKLSDSSHNLAASVQLKMEQKEKKTRYNVIVGSTIDVILGLLITFFILIHKTGKRVKWSAQVKATNSLAEIRTATNNFSQTLVIGEGGFGKVYKALIHDGVTTVAVKRCTKHPVIHRDVKSTNILLDHNLVAKIADFGLSRIGPTSASCNHVSTDVKGTFGYLDPEYYRRRKLTENSDIYSFGVVLFEVFCGRPVVNPMAVEEDGEKIGLAKWAWQSHLSGEFHRMMDPRLKGRVPSGCLKEFVDIGIECLAEKSTDRPTMGEMLSNLEKLLLLHESLDGQETNGDALIHIGINENTTSNRLVDEQYLHDELVPMD